MLPQLGIKLMSAFIHGLVEIGIMQLYKPRFHLNVVEREKMPFQRIEILHYYNHFELIVPLNPSTKLTAPGLSQARLKSSGKNLGCFFFLNSI